MDPTQSSRPTDTGPVAKTGDDWQLSKHVRVARLADTSAVLLDLLTFHMFDLAPPTAAALETLTGPMPVPSTPDRIDQELFAPMPAPAADPALVAQLAAAASRLGWITHAESAV